MRSRAFQDVPDKELEPLNQIKEKPAISRAKLAEGLNISERQVRKITERLKGKGILVREGGDSGKW
jgi:DNA-binding Lrp family transcriptional regulator